MKLSVRTHPDEFDAQDTIVLFLSDEFNAAASQEIPPSLSDLRTRIDFGFFRGRPGDLIFLPFSERPAVILAGIGKRKDLSAESLRNAAAKVIASCAKHRIARVMMIAPAVDALPPADVIAALAEGAYLSNYSFKKYKSKKDNDFTVGEAVFFHKNPNELRTRLREIEIACDNTLRCRDLVNETSDRSNPVEIAKLAKSLARGRRLSCQVLGKKEIERLGMGLLLAVSRGSSYPPQLVVFKYAGNPRSKKCIALVGKGITFDSGGLNLKPSGHIEDMRTDMAGAAACLYAVKSAAELGIKKNVVAVVPLCENMLSSNSFRPGDVYRAYNGKTVEIGNTDAEGRLILADALAYTEERFTPSYIIDAATLTGACLVCFGEIIAALLTGDDALAQAIATAGDITGDRVWRLPLDKGYDDDIKSDIADMNNISSGRQAGTIIGAVFMKNFVKSAPWAHLDIAGTSWYTKERGYRPKYATGYGVRLFLELVKRLEP
ncbi:MAG TPA: leucyl aminopeptidase [Spirochaetota bacterium]|nr:leucyl aminopeptidase [Spirochaetota bacterium]HPI22869.1 leucyl aminopeptidase [Spirochaetota bacterium]HPU89433.1 leucyl aminopeptidase [Spirochaetota bacterium]